MKTFAPRLDILPPPQRQLWLELVVVPRHFVLYGGTAIALRLGHRQSADFDFFSSATFTPEGLIEAMPLLAPATLLQSKENTVSVELNRSGSVMLSFLGSLTLGRTGEPEAAQNHGLAVASLRDLGGTKVAVIQQRALSKDYIDAAAVREIPKIPRVSDQISL